jgi:putative hemolysin
MDPLTNLLGVQAAQMTETFLLRELQTPGIAKPPGKDALNLTAGAYRLRFAESHEDLEAACRLRFLVFNLELGEGLETAYEQGHDTDEFDAVCDHLIVEHCRTRQVVGTYRLQTGTSAARNLGYYSAREFDFSPYESLRSSIVELGRASIHREHRSFQVLALLWRGIAAEAKERQARYLIGCSSLTSQDPRVGSAMYLSLQRYLVDPTFRTAPLPDYAMPMLSSDSPNAKVQPPKLLRAYLSIGANICGRPALDREFKTIDFLTLLDLESMSSCARSRFL